MVIDGELISIAKEACYLTDTASPEEILRLKTITEDAVIKIAHLLGLPKDFDFTVPSMARPILKNYIFYAWNDVSEEFEGRYLSDIVQAQDYYKVKGCSADD